MSAIRFLTALAKSVHSKLFSDDSTLKQVQPLFSLIGLDLRSNHSPKLLLPELLLPHG